MFIIFSKQFLNSKSKNWLRVLQDYLEKQEKHALPDFYRRPGSQYFPFLLKSDAKLNTKTILEENMNHM